MEFIQEQLNEIKELLEKQNLQQQEFLTLKEASEYLQLSKSCLYKITSKKEIPFYAPGGKKIYFKKVELDNWILSSRVSSTNDIGLEVENYLSRTSKGLAS